MSSCRATNANAALAIHELSDAWSADSASDVERAEKAAKEAVAGITPEAIAAMAEGPEVSGGPCSSDVLPERKCDACGEALWGAWFQTNGWHFCSIECEKTKDVRHPPQRTNEATVQRLSAVDQMIKDHASEVADWKRRALKAEAELDEKDPGTNEARACSYCGNTREQGHTRRCSVTRFAVDEVWVEAKGRRAGINEPHKQCPDCEEYCACPRTPDGVADAVLSRSMPPRGEKHALPVRSRPDNPSPTPEIGCKWCGRCVLAGPPCCDFTAELCELLDQVAAARKLQSRESKSRARLQAKYDALVKERSETTLPDPWVLAQACWDAVPFGCDGQASLEAIHDVLKAALTGGDGGEE